MKFTLEEGTYGTQLPTFSEIWFGIGVQLKSIHFVASGDGDYFPEDGSDPVPAKLSFKGLGIVNNIIPEDHPLAWDLPSGDTIMYIGEFIKIHAI